MSRCMRNIHTINVDTASLRIQYQFKRNLQEPELDKNNVRNLIAEFRGREITEQPLAEQRKHVFYLY